MTSLHAGGAIVAAKPLTTGGHFWRALHRVFLTTMAPSGVERSHRHVGIDAARIVAMMAVVVIHSLTAQRFEFGTGEKAFLDQACRWAVPFFFVASGYFLGRQHISGRARLSAPLLRLAPLFLGWSLLYVALSRDGVRHLLEPEAFYRWITTGGAAWHLWFLPSLAVCLVTTLAMHRVGVGLPGMLAIAAGIYLLGLALGSYYFLLSEAPFDRAIAETRLPLLDGHGGLFPLIFVVIGFALAADRLHVPRWGGPALFVSGAALHFVEGVYLDRHGWAPFISNEMLVGTIAFGTGAFLLAKQMNDGRPVRILAKVGIYSIGIYVCHILILNAIRKTYHPIDLGGGLLLSLSVFTISFTFVALMYKIRPLRIFLT